ncbi:sensor histidine kinase [Chitinophaga solisilvae]|uniref:histidine kinase n=1 Tax=Chitinophaga solisilvae TaxID=1233460 RepID=A0A433WG07_9BACT|nr:HAMP domain-containing sensor histidine kinase [Chitinophaga solisilvae]NSL87351.1 HAMP domain-containing histidine kinase [Chitinophaga solisilvae]
MHPTPHNDTPRKLSATFTYLVGQPSDIPLENRIFNSMCLIALIVIIINIPFNYFTGLRVTATLLAVMLLLLSGLYYLSRFRNRFHFSVTIAVIAVNVMFAINYFTSCGIAGASLLSFALTFFLVMMVSPGKQYSWWLGLNLLLVLGLIGYEYYVPQSVPDIYPDRASRFMDLSVTYVISVLVIFSGTLFMKNIYTREKKRGEEKARVLEQLNEEKNKLFSIISHDLRNPLSSIQSYLELMKNIQLPQHERLQMEEELLHMVNNTQDMLLNILYWSKSQLQGLSVQLSPVNIFKTISPILHHNTTLMASKKLRLEENIDNRIQAMADINMLQLILRNLIGNAIKFTPAGGSIHISAEQQENNCLLTIRDTGKGIDVKRMAEIFSLKARSTFGTGNEKGIGLGLYLCKEYTEAQSGRIWFENNPGNGCTFFLSFPAA